MSNRGKLTKLALTLLCSSILFCGCAKNSDVLITVNDKPITRGQYYEDFNRIKSIQMKNAPEEVKKDSSLASLALKERYTNDIIVRELLNQEFEKRNIQATEDEIKAKKAEIIKQMGSEEQFNKILKENNISNERVNSDMASEVKMEKLVKTLGVKEASDADAMKFYNQNKAQFNLPERVKCSHILIDADADSIKRKMVDADKEAKLSSIDIDSRVKEEVAKKEALAKEVLEKAKKNPKDFANLAKQYSEDPGSKEKGGDLGYITRESVVPEFANAAFSLKPNTVSNLVKSQYGYHIIIVKDKAAKGVQPFNEVKNELKTFLSQQKKIEAVQKFITGLKDGAKIDYLDESLKPETIKKQIDEAIKKQIEKDKKDHPEQAGPQGPQGPQPQAPQGQAPAQPAK